MIFGKADNQLVLCSLSLVCIFHIILKSAKADFILHVPQCATYKQDHAITRNIQKTESSHTLKISKEIPRDYLTKIIWTSELTLKNSFKICIYHTPSRLIQSTNSLYFKKSSSCLLFTIFSWSGFYFPTANIHGNGWTIFTWEIQGNRTLKTWPFWLVKVFCFKNTSYLWPQYHPMIGSKDLFPLSGIQPNKRNLWITTTSLL